MLLPDVVRSVLGRYVTKFPVPFGVPGEAFEETVRQWSIRFAEQVAWEVGSEWGMKRADYGRPISKDTISQMVDGRLLVWDLLTGAGTGSPQLVDQPESQDVTGQVFVPVTPKNHLVVAPIPPTLPPADLGPVMVELSKISASIDTLRQSVETVHTDLIAAIDNALISANAAEQRHQELLALLRHLDEKEIRVTLPDGTLRIGGRAVGQVDFPN